MTAVLGIDAAWTATQPSGVALIENSGSVWRLIAVAASYLNFVDGGKRPISEQGRPSPSIMDLGTMLNAASSKIGGSSVDLIAVDMPLARTALAAAPTMQFRAPTGLGNAERTRRAQFVRVRSAMRCALRVRLPAIRF